MSTSRVDDLVSLRRRALFFILAAAFLWSLGGLLIKWVSWHPVAIAGMRSAISALLMLAYLKRPKFTWSAAQIAGAFSYAATVISFVMANKMTTAANVILLQYTAPIYVAVFGSWFLGEKTSKLDWITIFVTIGGMALFFMDNLTTGGFWGNIIAIFSGIAFASLVVLARKQKNGSPLESFLLGNILTAIIGVPFMFSATPPDAAGWGGLLILGVVQLGLSYILYAEAMKHVTALEGSLIPVIEPVLNPIWVFLMLGEAPGKWAVVGGLIVLVAVTARCVISALKQTKVTEAT